MNPIENLWAILKVKVADKQPNRAKEMETAIKVVWIHEISVEHCRSVVEKNAETFGVHYYVMQDILNIDCSDNSITKSICL